MKLLELLSKTFIILSYNDNIIFINVYKEVSNEICIKLSIIIHTEAVSPSVIVNVLSLPKFTSLNPTSAGCPTCNDKTVFSYLDLGFI